MLTVDAPNYEVIRHARRKAVALRVYEGKIQVLVPKRFPQHHIPNVLQENASWISKKLAEQARLPAHIPKRYITGETFLYLGESYHLTVALGKPMGVMCRDKQLFVFVKPAITEAKKSVDVYKQLQQWYCDRALEYLQQRSHLYAMQLGVNFRSLTVRQFKSQWGSCSVDGDIQYNWKIILAPPHIIDYLVVHELAHIKHHNHSSRFWRLVESLVPNYKACKQWLNKQGRTLRID